MSQPRAPWWRFTAVFVVALTIAFSLQYRGFVFGMLEFRYEDARVSWQKNAKLAASYGNRHFDASDPDEYNVRYAEHFYFRALDIDPEYPFAHHQLARLAFLRSDYGPARAHINEEIRLHSPASSYYVRGLIRGFEGNFTGAAEDFREYLKSDPSNWAATNDLAWVLLKDERYAETLTAIDSVISHWPENPWLLNAKATALYELGRYDDALVSVTAAAASVGKVTEKEWSHAYPGNDPLIAAQGLDAFQDAVFENMHTIMLAAKKGSENVR